MPLNITMALSLSSFPRFSDFPEELICKVLDQLEPEEKTVMGLTNNSMADWLTITLNGTDIRPWESLKGDVLFRVLCAIEKDRDPHLIPCRSCLQLHLPNKWFPSNIIDNNPSRRKRNPI